MVFDKNDFDLYKLKVDNYLNHPEKYNLNSLVEDIKGAGFTGKISQSECEYLINILPIETDKDFDADDCFPEEKGTKNHFSFDDMDMFAGIRTHEKDELDDFEEEDDDEPQFGFLNF